MAGGWVPGRKFRPKAHSVGPDSRRAPVYWANDLFLRRAISMAADMAESGRTAPPRTYRHGHSRAPVSAPRRTLDSSGQAWLASLCGPAETASARAALHLAHPSDRPRGDPDHASARPDRGGQGFRA